MHHFRKYRKTGEMAKIHLPQWLRRWFRKLIKLWAVCATVYILCFAIAMLLVHTGLTTWKDGVGYLLAIVGAGAFVIIPVSGLAFLILSGQRLFYRAVPESMRKHVFWITWLEDRERKREQRHS